MTASSYRNPLPSRQSSIDQSQSRADFPSQCSFHGEGQPAPEDAIAPRPLQALPPCKSRTAHGIARPRCVSRCRGRAAPRQGAAGQSGLQESWQERAGGVTGGRVTAELSDCFRQARASTGRSSPRDQRRAAVRRERRAPRNGRAGTTGQSRVAVVSSNSSSTDKRRGMIFCSYDHSIAMASALRLPSTPIGGNCASACGASARLARSMR